MIFNVKKYSKKSIIYFLCNDHEVVYVGKTRSGIESRLIYHKKWMNFNTVYYKKVNNDQLDKAELDCINLFNPRYNMVRNDHNFCNLWDGISIWRRRTRIGYDSFPFYSRTYYKIRGIKYIMKNGGFKRTRYCRLWDGINREINNGNLLIRNMKPEKANISTYIRRKKQLFGNSYKEHKNSNLSKERIKLKISSQQLSKMLGWGVGKIGSVERGDLRLNWEDKIIVSRFFNKPIDYLFNNEPVMLDKVWYGMNNANWTNGYYGYYKIRKHA